MGTKLSCHWQRTHQSEADDIWLKEWSPMHIKIVFDSDTDIPGLDTALRCVNPKGRVIIRHYMISENWANRGWAKVGDAIASGVKAANHVEYLFGLAQKKYGAKADQLLFSALNEPNIWAEGESPEKTTAYYVAFMNKLHSIGLRAMVLNLGVGWPGNGGIADAPPDWAPFEAVRKAMLEGDVLGLHEYWDQDGPQKNWGWWAGRYKQCPWRVPIVIGECGIDSGVNAYGSHWGYQAIPGDFNSIYLEHLRWYDAKLHEDSRILSAMPFTYDFAHPWGTFNIRELGFLNLFGPYVANLPQHDHGVPSLPPVIVPPGDKMDITIVDNRGIADSSYSILPKNPTFEQVQAAFKFKIDRSKGWDATAEGKQCWKLSKLELRTGFTGYIPHVVDESGKNMANILLFRHWPGVDPLPFEQVPNPKYQVNAVAGFSDGNGVVGFKYMETSRVSDLGGPDTIWCSASPNGAEPQYSDALANLGFLGTDLTANPIFQLTTKTVVPPAFWGHAKLTQWKDLVYKYMGQLKPEWIGTIIMLESNADPKAISPAGAVGLMQVMPLAGRPPKEALLNPEINIDWGCSILRENLAKQGQLDLALAQYYGGQGLVNRIKNKEQAAYNKWNEYLDAFIKWWKLCAAAETNAGLETTWKECPVQHQTIEAGPDPLAEAIKLNQELYQVIQLVSTKLKQMEELLNDVKM